jgi:proteic killer suppression protein
VVSRQDTTARHTYLNEIRCAAAFLEALNTPPGNRLEALKGGLAGKHSIRINDQWRIVIRWTDAGPEDVEIVDYR